MPGGEWLVTGALVVQAREQTGNGNIFVQRLLVQTAAAEADLFALLRRAVDEAWKPRKRNAENPAVTQIDPHAVFIEAHACRTS